MSDIPMCATLSSFDLRDILRISDRDVIALLYGLQQARGIHPHEQQFYDKYLDPRRKDKSLEGFMCADVLDIIAIMSIVDEPTRQKILDRLRQLAWWKNDEIVEEMEADLEYERALLAAKAAKAA